MNIALKQLRVFLTVAQERTITAAAEKLYLSKPAVSMALSELEKHLGHRVFDRNNNRLIINEHGRRLLPLADELLARCNAIEQLFDHSSLITGSLKIGSSHTIGNQITPFLLRDFRANTEHKEQSIFISNSDQIAHKIAEFELDIGLIEGRVQHPDLDMKAWLKDDMVIVCHKDHPLAQLESISPTDLENQEWILRENGSGTRTFFLNRVASQLEHWKVAFELNTTESILNCISAQLGISCLSKLAVERNVESHDLVMIQPEHINMSRQYWLLYHKEKYQSPLLQLFINFSQTWQHPTLN